MSMLPLNINVSGNDDVNITDPPRQQSVQHSIIATIQEKIRNGTYKIEIAPSDLVDFGGQRSFDMTHQLFMRHKGTFVLMFNGSIDISVDLGEETTECKLVVAIMECCTDCCLGGSVIFTSSFPETALVDMVISLHWGMVCVSGIIFPLS
jgi:hypothetical protein